MGSAKKGNLQQRCVVVGASGRSRRYVTCAKFGGPPFAWLDRLCVCKENAAVIHSRFSASMITEAWRHNNRCSWMRDGWFVWRNAEPGWYIMKPISGPLAQDGKLRVFKSARDAMRTADLIIHIPKKPQSLRERLMRNFW